MATPARSGAGPDRSRRAVGRPVPSRGPAVPPRADRSRQGPPLDGRPAAASRSGISAAGDAASTLLAGRSAAIDRVRFLLRRFAAADAGVLITGDCGTGKNVAARCLHELSPRAFGPFVTVDCPALPDDLLDAELFGMAAGVATGVEARCGRLETADGGTLFLDEVGDLSPAAQARLLRFLTDHSVRPVGGRTARRLDVRIVAATNHALEGAVAQGRFRRDLYHRLCIGQVAIPPLRDRREDLADLVASLLDALGHAGVEITPAAWDALAAHDYPGNVRELQNGLRSALAFGDGRSVELDDLPPAFSRHGGGAGAAR